MATVQDVINQAYAKVNGEFEVVTAGGDDWNTYLNVLNQVMQIWGDTPYVKWQSLFNPSYTLPTPVAANTLDYAVPDYDRIRLANSPFDNVFFLNGDVVQRKYKMTDQALFQASNFTQMCALFAGTLYLKAISDDMIGNTIQIPVYLMPPQYTDPTTTVIVDSVPWLTTYMAAFLSDASSVPFIARNADKFYKQADILMKTMKNDNRHKQHMAIKLAGQTIDDQRFSSLSQAINAGVGAGGGDLNSVDGGQF